MTDAGGPDGLALSRAFFHEVVAPLIDDLRALSVAALLEPRRSE